MYIHNISRKNSILNTFISEIRSTTIQSDRMRFRKNIERIGEVLAYEMSKYLDYKATAIKTPLGISHVNLPQNDLVLCSILRAGVPLHNGLLNYFDTADNAFISAYRRHHHNPETIDIVIEYMASPSIEGKTLVLVDPMLATGQSLRTAFEALKPFGTPDSIHLACVIGSEDGINFIRKAFPKNTHLWIAAVDPILNDHGYIVPGLGDAGDLAFGEKL